MQKSELRLWSLELESLCVPMLYPESDVIQSEWSSRVRRGRQLATLLYGVGVQENVRTELRRLLPLLMFQSACPVFGGRSLSLLLRQSHRCQLLLPDGLDESRFRLYLYGLTYNGSLLQRVGRWVADCSRDEIIQSNPSWQRLCQDYRSLRTYAFPAVPVANVRGICI